MVGVKPKVSVIVPVYNVEKFLRRCMNSLISQTFKDIEIIAINDGSTDESLEILREYELKDSRVRIINKVNEGLSQTRNVGIDLAKGEYLTFVDSDDWIHKDMIRRMYSIIKENSCDVTLCSYMRAYEEKVIPKDLGFAKLSIYDEEETRKKVFRRIIGPIGEELKSPESLDSLVTAWGKLYKTSIIKENNIKFIDTKLIGTEDLLFNVYVFNYVKKSAVINEALYNYWKGNTSSLTSGYKPMLKEQWSNKHDLIKRFLDKTKAELIFYEALNNRICLSTLGLGINESSTSNKASELNKVKRFKEILEEERVQKAFKGLDLKYMPIHWKMFYYSNKNGAASISYLLIKAINVLRKVV